MAHPSGNRPQLPTSGTIRRIAAGAKIKIPAGGSQRQPSLFAHLKGVAVPDLNRWTEMANIPPGYWSLSCHDLWAIEIQIEFEWVIAGKIVVISGSPAIHGQ